MELRAQIVAEELRFGADRAAAAAKVAKEARARRTEIEGRAGGGHRRGGAKPRSASPSATAARTQAWGMLTKLRGEQERVAVRVGGAEGPRGRGRRLARSGCGPSSGR